MRLAVISDIHGNLEAFKEVLSDIDKCRIDTVVCLGDNIGYGPEPDQVVSLIRERNIPCVLGNHELGVIDPEYLSWFNSNARKSLKITAQLLSAENMHFISGLEPALICYECRFVHGFPPDSATTYLFEISKEDLLNVFDQAKEKLCFIGHTHTLEIISFDGHTLKHSVLTKTTQTLHKDHQYIINIGSVGQPRDGNNNAKYVIWDRSEYSLEVKFIPYDINRVVQKIQAAGLPAEHGTRLW